MARSKETFSKKELEKKKLQKRKEKAARKEERKEAGKRSFEDMIAYMDEDGNIVATPPDPTKKKKEMKVKDIVIGARNSGDSEAEDPVRTGKVTFFNDSKGYGFIRDIETGDSVFVHVNGLIDEINESDKVTFETERGPKGMTAVKVALFVAEKVQKVVVKDESKEESSDSEEEATGSEEEVTGSEEETKEE